MTLRDDDLTWREVDGCVVVLDLRRSEFHELNRAGSTLWRRLAKGPADIDDLVDLLSETYGIPDEQSRADAEDFVRALAQTGFVQG